MDVDEQLNAWTKCDVSPTTKELGVAVTFRYPLQESTIHAFDIIFIPDPRLQLVNKQKAMNDLAFIQMTITDQEYNMVKHLEGSMHSMGVVAGHPGSNTLTMRSKAGQGPPKYRVCMQEWVCHLLH